MEHLQNLIGKKVIKYPSPKPFKSGFKTNTVKGIITHEITSLPAFIFEEDDSYVEVRKCIPENFKIDFKEVYRLYPGCRVVRVVEFYKPGKAWTKEWDNNIKIQNSKLDVEDQIKRCWLENGKTIMLRIEHKGQIIEADYKIDELVTF
jgi:hypothetical protein